MTVRVLLFAALADLAQAPTVEIDLPSVASVAELLAALGEKVPTLRPLLPTCRVAINQQFVGSGAQVPSTGEIAIIPPVSGG